MRKWLWASAIAAGMVVLAGAVFAGYCYVAAARDGVLVVRSVAVEPERLPVGETATARVSVLVPWGQELNGTTLENGAGVIASGTPAVAAGAWECAGHVRSVRCMVKAVRPGRLETGSLKLALERPLFRNGARMFEENVKLPELEAFVPEIPVDAQLPLAGAIEPAPLPEHRHTLWFAVGGVLLVLGIVLTLWAFLRRRGALPPPEPWTVATRALADLRSESRSGRRPAAWCVARLTDVIRDYLSARFGLPFSRQTTGEFLHSLNRPDSPLSVRQGRELGEFLTAADLVKFAGEIPERGYLDGAIDKAERLVEETKPQEPSAASEHSGKEA